jgi:hypothetical protein
MIEAICLAYVGGFAMMFSQLLQPKIENRSVSGGAMLAIVASSMSCVSSACMTHPVIGCVLSALCFIIPVLIGYKQIRRDKI